LEIDPYQPSIPLHLPQRAGGFFSFSAILNGRVGKI